MKNNTFRWLRRMVALLLCLCLACGGLSGMAFAVETPPEETLEEGPTEPTEEPVMEPEYQIQVEDISGYYNEPVDLTIRVEDVGGTGWQKVEASLSPDDPEQRTDLTEALLLNGMAAYTVSENCTVYFFITDTEGTEHTKTYLVSCFDFDSPKAQAGIRSGLLRVEATDVLSGVRGIYVNDCLYTTLEDGVLELWIENCTDEPLFYIQAVDWLGNESGYVVISNPFYEEAVEESPDETPKEEPEKDCPKDCDCRNQATVTTPSTGAASATNTSATQSGTTVSDKTDAPVTIEQGEGFTANGSAVTRDLLYDKYTNKQFIAVPNHLTEQWASEFLRLYPSANILVATKKDFEARNRKKFCAKIATGDYDAVIIGHSQFERIPVSQERQERLLQEQIAEIEDGLDELRSSGAERFTIKSLERTKKSLETKLKKLQDSTRKDDVVTFEQLGVDRLFVDEAHSYKNLFLYTKMRNVAGLSPTDAQKSSDMLLKCRYIDELTGGKGVVFATGTPVSNSMTELYTMMRYLQHDMLKDHGWAHFDCWASQFGETKTAIELAPEGTGYRARTRFAKFFNLPELITLWKEAADVKTADQLNLPRPTAVYHNEVAQPTEQQQALVQELSKRAALVHSGSVDPGRDNMLKITSDGRKLGLDQRIINPDLPDDPGSKVNLCVSNIKRIWEDGQADKLTQLVFCDISTPKGRSVPERIAAKAPAGNLDSPELHALESLISESEAEPQFSVYEDIRSKLIAQGIPAEQIAFIHDANTEARKKELFAKVRTGQVRVLIGSTFKMGAGMNVQDRLIALHDLDCPWRPGDLEQRSGRIVRQGNMNPEVHIYRYVTEGTFDSFLWQTVETKQKFISQIMTSKSPVRSCEDVDETALSYAEIKALCAGDPRIREKMDLDIDVARLKLLKADHQSQQFRLEDNLLKHFPEQIERSKGFIAGFQADMETLAAHPHPKDGFAGMEIRGDKLTDKENAGAALLDAMKDATGLEPVPIGSYRGFAMSLTLEDFGREYVLTLKGQMTHRVTLGKDARGNLTRIDNVLNQMPERLKNVDAQQQTLYAQVESAKAELGKPFPQEAELRQKSERLAELNTLLDMDGKGSQERTAGESAVAKSSRPSVLEKLRSMSATEPPHSAKNHHRTEEIR